MHSACPCHSLACALMLVQVGDAVLPVKLLPEEAALVLKHGFVSLSLPGSWRQGYAGRPLLGVDVRLRAHPPRRHCHQTPLLTA